MLVGVAGVPVGAALDWLALGGVSRSAFSLARHASELGLVDTGAAHAAVLALFLSPVLVGVIVIALSMGWVRVAAAMSLLLGLVAWAAGLLVLRLDLGVKQGPLVTSLAGAFCLIGGVAVWSTQRRATQASRLTRR